MSNDLGPALPPLWRVLFASISIGSAYVCSSMFSWLVEDGRQKPYLAWMDRTQDGPLLILPIADKSVLIRCAYNALLFAVFALHHAGLASLGARDWMERMGLPRRGVRSVFLLVTAAMWSLLVFMWQRTGVYLWDLRPVLPAGALTAQELAGTFMVIMVFRTVFMMDAFQFFGVRQALGGSPFETGGQHRTTAAEKARAEAAPKLCTTGRLSYGLVRHPMYMWLLGAAIFAPVTLSLDRLVWTACAAAFLQFALPREEAKLVEIFGDEYVQYQCVRPAFIPFGPVWLGSGPGALNGEKAKGS